MKTSEPRYFIQPIEMRGDCFLLLRKEIEALPRRGRTWREKTVAHSMEMFPRLHPEDDISCQPHFPLELWVKAGSALSQGKCGVMKPKRGLR